MTYLIFDISLEVQGPYAVVLFFELQKRQLKVY